MNRIFTLLLLAITVQAYTQDTKSVVTGSNYADDVYYSFEGGALKTADRSEWDIAFTTAQMSVSILANNGAGVNLYAYYGGDINNWNEVDTTGMSWIPLYNSIETWEFGAFNISPVPDDPFDFSWGVYNPANHNIDGDSIFIIALATGEFKKLAIIQKNAVANQWMFKYADLNGENEVSETFDADDYPGKEFVHYSIMNGQFADHEPATRWQLLFTRYFDYTIPYFVSGVLANEYVIIQQVNGVDQAGYMDYDPMLFNDTISEIGSDWKEFNMGTFTYDVAPDVVYFVQDTLEGSNSPVWKLYFTEFSGSSTGTYTFVQQKLGTTGSKSLKSTVFSVYPNPASDQLNLVNNIDGEYQVRICNMNGQVVLSKMINGKNVIDNQVIDISFLSPGIYNLGLYREGEVESLKFIKK